MNIDDANLDFEQLPDSLLSNANKELQKRILEAKLKIQQRKNDVEQQQNRNALVSEHLKAVRAEHMHTQQLLEAKNKEIETENHLKMIAEREVGRLKAEVIK